MPKFAFKNKLLNTRALAIAALLTIFLSITAIGTNAAGYSIVDSVKSFLYSAGAELNLVNADTSGDQNIKDALIDEKSSDVNTSSLNLSTTITQNFDGIGSTATATLPTDFKVDKNTTTARLVGNYATAATVTEQAGGGNPAVSAGAIYNFFSGTVSTGTDRAIGFLSSGGGSAPKGGNIYVKLTNNTGSNLSGLTVSYDIEKYRNGSNANGFAVQMYYSTDGSNWSSAGSNFQTLFGSDADNTGFASGPGVTRNVTSQILSQPIANNGTLYLAWNYSVASGTTYTNAQALALDNVVISGNAAVAAPSNLVYSSPTAVYTTNTAITDNTPTVTGSVDSYSISPALPAGLTLNTTTGVISGTPTVASPATDYTVTASNGGGSTTATVNITVNPPAPSNLSYASPVTYTKDSAITNNTPTVTGTVSGYSVAPTLPAGLSINPTSGVISGTPTVASAAADYVVTASNAGGSTTATVNITVVNATYSLSYNANGGTGTVPATQNGEEASTLTVADGTGLTREGYTFAGWNTAADGSGTPYAAASTFTIPASNTTLYAQWTANTYSLSYDGNGNDGGSAPAIQSGAYNTTLTVAGVGSLTRTGYTFAGWNTAANGSGTAIAAGATFTIPASDTTLYAQWTINTYAITVTQSANGTISPATTSVNHGANQTFTIAADPGYKIADVLVDSVSQGVVSTYEFTNVTETHTITATFSPNNTTITANGNLAAGTYFNVTISNNAMATLTGDVVILGTLTVENGAALVTGQYSVSGGGSFFLADGATLSIGSPDGITAAPAAAGSIRTTARTFSPLANYVYVFNNNQSVGNGLPATVKSLTIFNSGIAPANKVTGNNGQIVTTNLWIQNGVYESHSDYADVTIEALGTLELTGDTTVSGNWTNNGGTLVPNGYRVTLDGLTGQTITGSTNFAKLTKSVTTAQTLNFGSGTTTVTDQLTLTGAAGQLLSIRSTTAGVVRTLVAPTATTASYVDVQDNNNTGVSITTSNSVNSGNTSGWDFPLASYTLTYTAGAGGTISGISPQTVAQGGSGTPVTAVPNAGYSFTGWSDGVTTATRTDTNVLADVTVTASFTANVYTLSYDANGATGGIAPAAQTGNIGVDVTVSGAGSLVKTGYTFAGWNTVADGSGTPYAAASNYTFGTSNATLFAQWTINQYTITATSGANGSVTPAGATTVNFGVDQAYAITPNAGYHIADVLVDGSSVGAVSSYNFPAVSANHTISATFAINEYTLTTSATNGSIGASPAPNGSGGKYTHATSVTLTATPNAGYSFTGWSGACTGTGSCVVVMDGDKSVTATFAILTYTINASATGTGTISPVGTTTVNYNASQVYTLTPDSGSALTSLVVDGTPVSLPSGNTYTFSNVTANHTIAANFSSNVGVSTPVLTAQTNSAVTIPVNTTDVTGRNVISADFTFSYDATVLSPLPADISVTAGSVPPSGVDAPLITVNTNTAGTIIVSAFSSQPWTGAGPIVNIGMKTIGAVGTTTPLTLSAFSYNGGTVTTDVTSGSLTITSTATTTTVTSSENPSIYGTPVTFTAAVSPIPTGGTVQFVIDGANAGSPVPVNTLTGTATFTTSSLNVPASPHSVVANYSGDAPGYLASSGLLTGGQTVTRAADSISVGTTPASAIYGDTFQVSATSLSGTPVTVAASGGCSVSVGSSPWTVTMTSGVNACSLTFTVATSDNYTGTSTSTSTSAAKRPATWTTNPNSKVFGATEPSPLTTGSGEVSGTSRGFLAADLLTITATYSRANTSEDAGVYPITTVLAPTSVLGNYDVTYVGADFTINKADQTINVTNAAPTTAIYGDTFSVSATASSGLDVSILASGACSGSGTASATITMTSGTGTCTVTYSQAGNANYNAATDVTSTTTAAKRPATWITDPKSKIYLESEPIFTSHGVAATGAGSGFLALDLPTISASHTRVAGEDVGTYLITATLSSVPPSVLGNYVVTNDGALLTINKADQTITVTAAAPATAIYGESFTVSATASSNLPVSILASGVCSGGGTGSASITMTSGTGVCTITYSQAGNSNFNPAVDVTESTNAAKRPATWTTDPKSKQFGQADPTFTGSGSGFLPADNVTATYTREPGSAVSPPTYHITATLSANPGALANYDVTNDGAELTILKADQTITITAAAPLTAIYGESFNVAATASSGLTVSITASGACSGSGNGSASVTMTSGTGSCHIDYAQAGDGSYNAAPALSSDTAAEKRLAIWMTNPNGKLFEDLDPSPLTTGSGELLNGTRGFLAADLSQINAAYSRVAGETAGTYQISAALTPSGVLANYTVTNDGALFTISARTLTGTVTYRNAISPPVAVDATTISADGSPSVASILNNTDGTYLLSGFGASSYTISASKTPQTCSAIRGISSQDSALIARHVVQLITLNPTQVEAAKVSGTVNLSSFDAALIAQFVVCIPNPVNQTGQWKFTPVSTTVGSGTVADFGGLLKGDVTGDWTPGTSGPIANPISDDATTAVRVSTPNVATAPGTILNVPLRLDNLAGRAVDSYQFDVVYDPSVVEPAQGRVSLTGTNGEELAVVSNVVEPGLLKVAVYGAVSANGDGVYANLKFAAIGGEGTFSPLAIRGFRFNNATDGVSITDGRITVTSATSAGISGNVLTSTGEQVVRARVTLTSTTGETFTVVSNNFGRFGFGGLRIGETYTVTVRAKDLTFAPRQVSVTDSATEIDVIAQ